MVSGTRVPFDPDLPIVVAVTDLPCVGRRFKRGDVLLWRDMGLSDLDVARMYMTGHVDCIVPARAPAPAAVVQVPTPTLGERPDDAHTGEAIGGFDPPRGDEVDLSDAELERLTAPSSPQPRRRRGR